MIVDVAGRDERQTWMGDAFTDEVQSLAYLFDSPGLIARTVRSNYAGANSEGIPRTHATLDQPPGRPAEAGWADGGMAGAWGAWVNFADRRTLEHGYVASARYMDAVAAKAKNGLPGDNYVAFFGDWLSNRFTIKPGATGWEEMGGIGAPSDIFAAALWAKGLQATAQMARALGKEEEARRYEGLLAGAQAAMLKTFLRPDGMIQGGLSGSYAPKVKKFPGPAGGDEQSCYALLMEFLPEPEREKARPHLLKAIGKMDGHLGTGSFTTIPLLRYMADHGLQDLAYGMVMKPTCPSYGFMVDSGATAMWERWDSYHPQLGFNPEQMNGLNHLGQNSVYEWIFATLAGIRPDPAHPGYKHFFIQPQPPKGLDRVKARYNSVRGPIGVEWKREGDQIVWNVTVPWNTTATVKFPDGRTEKIAAGTRQFIIKQISSMESP
jgi:alpha-L-rhamnosidase